MVDKDWNTILRDCPIKLDRINGYAQEMETNLPSKITDENLNECKRSVILARGLLESIISTLVQGLYDQEILQKPQDKILYALMLENFSRFLGKVDSEEFNMIIKLDDPDISRSFVGVGRIASFSRFLQTALDSIVYETLEKATSEWKNIVPTDEIKKDKRSFLYILFHLLQVTLSIVGGLTREKSGSKKPSYLNTLQTVTPSWKSMMGQQGGKVLRDGYKQETGTDLSKLDPMVEELYDDFEETEEEEDV